MPLRDWVASAVLLLAVGSKVLWPHMRNCYHSVDEGHLGLYYRGGELQPYTAAPGAHFMVPFLYTFEQVKIGLRTETVRQVPCGTSGGVVLARRVAVEGVGLQLAQVRAAHVAGVAEEQRLRRRRRLPQEAARLAR